MEWINTNFFDAIEAVKSALLTYLLLPVRGFFVGIPWAWGVIAVGLAAGRLGGARFGTIADRSVSALARSSQQRLGLE